MENNFDSSTTCSAAVQLGIPCFQTSVVRPISPLLYSIASPGYYHYFRNLGRAFGLSRRRLEMMERPLGAIIGVHGGRMYYNLTSIHTVLRIAPFGDRLTSAFNQFVGADEIAAQPADAAEWGHRRGRVLQVLELFRIGAMTAWQYLFLRRRIESVRSLLMVGLGNLSLPASRGLCCTPNLKTRILFAFVARASRKDDNHTHDDQYGTTRPNRHSQGNSSQSQHCARGWL